MNHTALVPASASFVPVAPPSPILVGLWYSAAVFQRIHAAWEWAIYGQIYSKPDNWVGLALGHLIERNVGEYRLVQIPSLALMTGARLLDLFDQQEALSESFDLWKEAVRCLQPIPTLPFSPQNGTHAYWTITTHKAHIRTHRIALATLNLSIEVFKFIMRVMDVIKLVPLNQMEREALFRASEQQCIINLSRVIKAVKYNEDVFKQHLATLKPLFDASMKYMHVSVSFEELTSSIDQGINTLQTGNAYYEKVSSLFGTAAADLLKGFVYALSPQDLQPHVGVALNYDPFDNILCPKEKKEQPPFPDESRVTISLSLSTKGDIAASTPLPPQWGVQPYKKFSAMEWPVCIPSVTQKLAFGSLSI